MRHAFVVSMVAFAALVPSSQAAAGIIYAMSGYPDVSLTDGNLPTESFTDAVVNARAAVYFAPNDSLFI